jgi:U4/U6 small nuclear ribonucleoprotein PRP3
MANQVRQDAQLEALKQRIAESARKAGLDGEFDTLEKNIRVRLFLLFMPFHNFIDIL